MRLWNLELEPLDVGVMRGRSGEVVGTLTRRCIDLLYKRGEMERCLDGSNMCNLGVILYFFLKYLKFGSILDQKYLICMKHHSLSEVEVIFKI